MHSKRPGEKNKNVIILSDFTEGAWESVVFSCVNFITSNHGVVFVQTYCKPKCGQSLLKNIVPVMKQIVKNELLELKLKTMQEFQLEESQIFIHPFEGDWFSFFNTGQEALFPELLVLSMKKAFPEACCSFLGKIQKLATLTTKPLFILPSLFVPGKLRQILLLTGKKMSSLGKIEDHQSVCTLAQSTRIDLRILLDEVPSFSPFSSEQEQNPTQLQLQSRQTVHLKDTPQLLRETSEYDLVIIDHDLLQSSFAKVLNLKKWFRNKYATPVLIC